MALVRLGDGVVVSNPGEVTVEVGRRLKEAVAAELRGSGIRSVAISGLANEYQGYFTSPEEYAWQAYEGGQTNFGKFSSTLLVEQTGLLARTMARGEPAPAPYPFDPTNGLEPDRTPFPKGAEDAWVASQPGTTTRLRHAEFAWTGGPRGTDRPLDRAFVSVERRDRTGWHPVADDRDATIDWQVDGDEQVPLGPEYVKAADEGTYRARWEVPLDATPGQYRFVVTANRYELTSDRFRVGRGRVLDVVPVRAPEGRAAFVLAYPEPVPYEDLTYRPRAAAGGVARVRVGGRSVEVAANRAGVFVLDAVPGARVVVRSGAARDTFANRSRDVVRFVAGEPTRRRPSEPYPVLSPW